MEFSTSSCVWGVSMSAVPCWNPRGELIPSRIWCVWGGVTNGQQTSDLTVSPQGSLGTVHLDPARGKKIGDPLPAGHRMNWTLHRNLRGMGTLALLPADSAVLTFVTLNPLSDNGIKQRLERDPLVGGAQAAQLPWQAAPSYRKSHKLTSSREGQHLKGSTCHFNH